MIVLIVGTFTTPPPIPSNPDRPPATTEKARPIPTRSARYSTVAPVDGSTYDERNPPLATTWDAGRSRDQPTWTATPSRTSPKTAVRIVASTAFAMNPPSTAPDDVAAS